MNQLQIPVTIPQGMSRTNVDKITEQLTLYAQFLFSHVQHSRMEPSSSMSLAEAQRYLDSLSIKGANVPDNINGIKDIVNTKYL